MYIFGRCNTWNSILLGLLAVVSIKLYSFFLTWPDLIRLIELEKCPVCFGTSICPAFINGDVILSGHHSVYGVLNLIGSKNVLFASIGERKVVLKKLGHSWELQKLDKLERGENVRTAIIEHLRRPVVLDNSSSGGSFGLHLCPSVANVDHFLNNIYDKTSAVLQPDDLYINIWTLIVHNGEPLILQILDQEDGWPVPRYYGACGRIVVVEYVGSMLSSYLQAQWSTRARLAHQLLVAARDFTNKHPYFRFYLTDISMDNIAVSEAGIVKFIDLEDVIIVDKLVPDEERPASWTSSHTSEKFECDGCFAFSTDDICSHHISDHNYYAVCQQLLISPDGLLSDIPPEVLKVHPQLPDLVHECAYPSRNGKRFEVALQLITLLTNITEVSTTK